MASGFNPEWMIFLPWLLMPVINIFKTPCYYVSRKPPLSKVAMGVGCFSPVILWLAFSSSIYNCC